MISFVLALASASLTPTSSMAGVLDNGQEEVSIFFQLDGMPQNYQQYMNDIRVREVQFEFECGVSSALNLQSCNVVGDLPVDYPERELLVNFIEGRRVELRFGSTLPAEFARGSVAYKAFGGAIIRVPDRPRPSEHRCAPYVCIAH